MSNPSLSYFISHEDIDLNQLVPIGKRKINDYYHSLIKNITSLEIKIEPYSEKEPFLKIFKQDMPIILHGRIFIAALICLPHPTEKKQKPSGLIFNESTFLQVKEIVLYEIKTGQLYIYEYSYHFGIWNYDKDKEFYNFRYDREVMLANPPKKQIEHFHVYYNDPHFNSSIIKLNDTLDLIKNNWDTDNNKFFIKELVY